MQTVVAALFQTDSPCYCVPFLFRQHADQNFIYYFSWNIRLCLPFGKVKIDCFLKVLLYGCPLPLAS